MKTALLVIDMQNDYLWERRKPVFAYDTKGLTSAVNGLVHRYENVIYIRHLIQNLPTNRLLFGYSLAGTEGAALYGGLDVVSERVFDKYFGDALTNGALLRLIREERFDRLHLCGLDECGCVTATALGAARRGIVAEIVRIGTATVMPRRRIDRAHERLRRAGIRFI